MKKAEDRTYLQCTCCGKIYDVKRKFKTETLYVSQYCHHCGHDRALVVGDNEDDIYALYDPVLDERYYSY